MMADETEGGVASALAEASGRDRPAIILILHGSPRPSANQPACQIAEVLRGSDRFSQVMMAYLECNSPTIPEALDECASSGAKRVIAVPYFLHAGRHIVLDVPNLLLEAELRHPQMQILICDAVGTSPLIAKALTGRAHEALAKSS